MSFKTDSFVSSIYNDFNYMAFNLEAMKEIVYPLVGAIYEVHTELGPGLNEYVYQEGLAMQLEEDGLLFEREKELQIKYHGKLMDATYRMDFYCLGCVVIECKSVEKLTADHRAQLFNYMRLSRSAMGILVNFAPKSAVVERYFLNKDTNEICDTNGNSLIFYRNTKLYFDNNQDEE